MCGNPGDIINLNLPVFRKLKLSYFVIRKELSINKSIGMLSLCYQNICKSQNVDFEKPGASHTVLRT